DVHDIGKDIVVMFLGSRGFEVVDLGVDVSPEIFVEAVRQHNPLVLGMSALLTHTAPVIGEVIVRLRKAGLREKVKVLIGGAPITSAFAQSVGADYAAKDALDGVGKCLEWLGGIE
ncbi:MAG: cobalamin-dependent protein, partial [Candidatus Bathyarchaeota archaeon]